MQLKQTPSRTVTFGKLSHFQVSVHPDAVERHRPVAGCDRRRSERASAAETWITDQHI